MGVGQLRARNKAQLTYVEQRGRSPGLADETTISSLKGRKNPLQVLVSPLQGLKKTYVRDSQGFALAKIFRPFGAEDKIASFGAMLQLSAR
jgi:hypothetical protein